MPPSVATWVLASPHSEWMTQAAVAAPAPPEAEGKKWVAKWIWCEGEPVPQNFYFSDIRMFDKVAFDQHLIQTNKIAE